MSDGSSRSALQLNKSLVSVAWDRNGASVAALNAFSIAITRNHALQVLSLPLENIGLCMQGTVANSLEGAPGPSACPLTPTRTPTVRVSRAANEAATRAAVARIEAALARNQHAVLDVPTRQDLPRGMLVSIAQQEGGCLAVFSTLSLGRGSALARVRVCVCARGTDSSAGGGLHVSALERLAALLRRYMAEIPDDVKNTEDGRRILAQANLVLADVEAHRSVPRVAVGPWCAPHALTLPGRLRVRSQTRVVAASYRGRSRASWTRCTVSTSRS